MIPRHPLALVPALVLGAAVLWPAAAAPAATVGAQVPCVRVVPGLATFPVLATGFAPGAFLTFRTDGNYLGGGQADAGGNFDNFTRPFSPPFLPSSVNLKTVQLTADDGNGTVAGPVAVRMARLTVRVPDRARPTKRVRFRVFGFDAGRRVYLHIRRNNKTKGRFSLGVTSAPCGTVTKKLRFMPLKHYTTGTYRYAFSHSRRYDPSKVYFGGKVTIYKTFRASGAQATAASWGG